MRRPTHTVSIWRRVKGKQRRYPIICCNLLITACHRNSLQQLIQRLLMNPMFQKVLQHYNWTSSAQTSISQWQPSATTPRQGGTGPANIQNCVLRMPQPGKPALVSYRKSISEDVLTWNIKKAWYFWASPKRKSFCFFSSLGLTRVHHLYHCYYTYIISFHSTRTSS